MKLTNIASNNTEICNKSLYKDTEIKGILFDMDGVILDTEKLYTRFWVEAAQSLGYPMTYEMALGMRSLSRQAGERQLKAYLGEEADYFAVRETRIRIMEAFIEENGVELKPGIHELLAFLKEHGIKTSIATSSPLDRTKKYLAQVGLVDAFDALVSGHMVEHGKPEPDIYLYAASNLGLKPEECLVLEDSPTGILAAYRAGCVPVIVPDQDAPDEVTKTRVYAVVKDLLSVRDIAYNVSTKG
ncbi:MAG: HAD family phosphatase [Agathobacter sp.]|nr:HAD family phosphatase [Agathobacter sp.]